MTPFSINISKKAKKELDKMSDVIVAPILVSIQNLAENPRPNGYRKLKGRNGYRIRVGDYRIIYDIFETTLVIEVIDLGHRKNIYQ